MSRNASEHFKHYFQYAADEIGGLKALTSATRRYRLFLTDKIANTEPTAPQTRACAPRKEGDPLKNGDLPQEGDIPSFNTHDIQDLKDWAIARYKAAKLHHGEIPEALLIHELCAQQTAAIIERTQAALDDSAFRVDAPKDDAIAHRVKRELNRHVLSE
jgi:hypothetical protein